ncbi:1883_t:CDS:2 [Scutellospora calospora]|uniref:1883_t:CDS:1 n=1 Tax=Scutellospora calospora TaxID=85575 RepID=A0ACA9L048_9GLOM|nr:1883_t:CDS:2 [Scutellospora calospora]
MVMSKTIAIFLVSMIIVTYYIAFSAAQTPTSAAPVATPTSAAPVATPTGCPMVGHNCTGTTPCCSFFGTCGSGSVECGPGCIPEFSEFGACS